jgi:hypothetical protein
MQQERHPSYEHREIPRSYKNHLPMTLASPLLTPRHLLLAAAVCKALTYSPLRFSFLKEVSALKFLSNAFRVAPNAVSA